MFIAKFTHVRIMKYMLEYQLSENWTSPSHFSDIHFLRQAESYFHLSELDGWISLRPFLLAIIAFGLTPHRESQKDGETPADLVDCTANVG